MFRILIVDDEKMVLVSTENSFPFTKYNMEVAARTSDAFEALSWLKESRFDAALVDIRMPGISGTDIIRQCRDSDIHTEFIVVSGYSDFSYMKDSIQLGAFDYCLKPVQRKETDTILKRLYEKLYQNRLALDIDLLNRLFILKDIRPSLKYLGLEPNENNLTIFAISAQSISEALSINSFPGKNATFFLSDTKAIVIYAIPTADIPSVADQYLSVSKCHLACGNLDIVSGNFFSLLEQLQTDLMLTSDQNPQIQSIVNDKGDSFNLLLDEVRSQYTGEISLQMLAEKYNLNYSYCSELFKSATGFNFSKYIMKLRMTDASEQLLSTNESIAKISFSVGYRNYHHFVSMFKTYFGVTPTEYRKRQ